LLLDLIAGWSSGQLGVSDVSGDTWRLCQVFE